MPAAMRAIAKELETTKPQAHTSPSVVYFESKPKPTKGQAVASPPPATTRAVPEKAAATHAVAPTKQKAAAMCAVAPKKQKAAAKCAGAPMKQKPLPPAPSRRRRIRPRRYPSLASMAA